MFDNLRRSFVAPSLVIGTLAGALVAPQAMGLWLFSLLAVVGAMPILVATVLRIVLTR